MDPDADEQAMAQMMGFSSFGAQDRPQKKRRYNPHADAAIDANGVVGGGISKGSRRQPAAITGSNSTPLGTRITQSAENADEIDLDDGDGDGDGVPSVVVQGDAASVEITAPLETAASSQDDPIDAPHLHGLPQRPAQPTTEPTVGPPQQGHTSRAHHPSAGAGTRAPWYEGYYDSLSNRNPWERLEKSTGLSSKGTWITHEEHAASTA